MTVISTINGTLEVRRAPHEPTSIEVNGVDIVTILEAYSGLEVEIQIRIKE